MEDLINNIKNSFYKNKTCPNCNNILFFEYIDDFSTMHCKSCSFSFYFKNNFLLSLYIKKLNIYITINKLENTYNIYVNNKNIWYNNFINENLDVSLTDNFPYIDEGIIKYFENIIFE